MAAPADGHPEGIEHWDAGAFGKRLARGESAGQIFTVNGLQPSHLQRETPALRRALSQRGMPLFVLDPTGAAGASETMADILVDFVGRVDQRGQLTRQARDLFEFVSSSTNQAAGGLSPAGEANLQTDSLCRLWTSLSEQVPAVLLVFNAGHCSAADIQILGHLARFFFCDPIEQLAPEIGAGHQGRGRLVIIGADGGDGGLDLEELETVDIDLGQAAEASVRSFLSEPDIVRRFVDSTGGDPRRLGELVDSLPGDVGNFWLFRYEQLDALDQQLVDVLGVAGEPLEVDTLQAAMALLEASDYFGRSLRRLSDIGFVERAISAGVVRIHIENLEFATAVVETIDDSRRARIHRALADAARASDSVETAPRFLARHYLAAGQTEAALEFGRRAVKRLVARRSYERAGELLDALLAVADDDEQRRFLRAKSLDVHAALGNYRAALTHCEALLDLVDDTQHHIGLRCRAGQLLKMIGEYEAAIDRFGQAADAAGRHDELRDVWIHAKQGAGEVMYAQGNHREAEERAVEVIEQIEEARRQDDRDPQMLDRSLMDARNLIGKVGVLRGDCQRARQLFSLNRTMADDWGWDDEAARAEANLGLVALQQKDFAAALDRLQRARDIARSPAAIRRAYARLNLGIIHQRKGHFDDALGHYLQSLRVSRQEGDPAGYDLAAYNLATLYHDIGAFDRALGLIGHLEERRRQQPASQFVGSLPAVARGNVYLEQRQYEAALEVFSGLCDADNDPSTASSLPAREAKLRSVQAHLAVGQRQAAGRIIEQADALDQVGDQPQLDALYDLGRVLLALEDDDFSAVVSLAPSAAKAARSAGHRRDALRLEIAVIRARIGQSRPQEARALAEAQIQELHQQAPRIPHAYRRGFFGVPLHQELVELGRQLNGDIPADFDVGGDDPSPAADVDDRPVDADAPGFKQWRARYANMIGETKRLHQLFRMVDRIADSDSPVLLQGESGTGKELMAQAVHTHSRRDDQPFIKVNCGAFVDELLLSELFGHVEGAFTGAVSQKIGRFELADGGTIFLDEIGDISAKTQVALLRVLQDGAFEKVGGAETQQVDVRVVCATNKHLEEMVERGDFRLDLYYRLKGVVMELPALSERRQDIPRLVAHFAREFGQQTPPKTFSEDVLRFLSSYSWPGNIRELKNFVKSILLFVEGHRVEMSHVKEFGEFFADGEVDVDLPDIDYEVELEQYDDVGETFDDPEDALADRIVAEKLSLANIKKRLENESIRRALTATGGNITRAAEILQMKRPRLSQIVNGSDDLLALKQQLVG